LYLIIITYLKFTSFENYTNKINKNYNIYIYKIYASHCKYIFFYKNFIVSIHNKGKTSKRR